MVTYDLAAVAADSVAALEAARPALAVLALPDWHPHLVGLPFKEELLALAARTGGGDVFTSQLPAAWIFALTLAGTAEQVKRAIAERHDAGATTVVLTPVGIDPSTRLTELATVLPG